MDLCEMIDNFADVTSLGTPTISIKMFPLFNSRLTIRLVVTGTHFDRSPRMTTLDPSLKNKRQLMLCIWLKLPIFQSYVNAKIGAACHNWKSFLPHFDIFKPSVLELNSWKFVSVGFGNPWYPTKPVHHWKSNFALSSLYI